MPVMSGLAWVMDKVQMKQWRSAVVNQGRTGFADNVGFVRLQM